jgi:hypothetical protein
MKGEGRCCRAVLHKGKLVYENGRPLRSNYHHQRGPPTEDWTFRPPGNTLQHAYFDLKRAKESGLPPAGKMLFGPIRSTVPAVKFTTAKH